MIFMVAECTMVLGVCKELLVRTWNDTYPNLHTMNSCPKSRCVHTSSLKKPPLLRFFSSKWVVTYRRFQCINLLHVFNISLLGHNCFTLKSNAPWKLNWTLYIPSCLPLHLYSYILTIIIASLYCLQPARRKRPPIPSRAVGSPRSLKVSIGFL